jgi:hypothetical protein
MKTFDHIIYENPSDHGARIILNRVATAKALGLNGEKRE